MAAPGQGIVVGVSGGADSVCLLFVLQEYAKRTPVKLSVVHVNHGLRPDSGEDASFVEQLCLREGIPFFLREVDVKSFALRGKCTEEEAGRLLRYQAFREAAVSFDADRIAVAHNRNDMAETLLFNLFRGSGLKGLCGIPPVREEIIRPLLCLERSEVEEYLQERGIPSRTDSTNLEDDYTRNRIRHYLLPFAEEQVSARAVAHMCRTAELLSEAEDYLKQQTKEAEEHCVERDFAGFRIDAEHFKQLHIALQRRLLLHLITELSPGHKDISAVHVEDVLALFEKEGNPELNLPFDIRAQRSYGKVLLSRGGEQQEESVLLPIQIRLPLGETGKPLTFVMGRQSKVEFSVFFLKKGQKVPQNQYTKWFDCDKIMESPILRFRHTGDFLSISDGRGNIIHKSLKDYMITEKIPRHERDRTLLLTEGNHVLWLVGYRISEYYKVNENTKRVLQVKLLEDCSGSGTEEKDGGTHQGTFI